MNRKTKILLVEDDQELNDLLAEFLDLEGYQVTRVYDGATGLQKAKTNDYDILILDIMLPHMNGLDVLKEVRAHKNTPVLMLTARGKEIDRIVGFELGADDYLPKPCNPRELVARIKAILRRVDMDTQYAEQQSRKTPIKLEDVDLNPATRVVTIDDEVVDLTSTEFNLLENLMLNAGSVLSKEQLTERALGRKLTLYDRSIDMHLSNLRRKIGEFKDQEQRIKTVRGIGYLYVSR